MWDTLTGASTHQEQLLVHSVLVWLVTAVWSWPESSHTFLQGQSSSVFFDVGNSKLGTPPVFPLVLVQTDQERKIEFWPMVYLVWHYLLC